MLQIIARQNKTEKLLVVAKQRKGHKCNQAWIVIAVVVWEAVDRRLADESYDLLAHKLSNWGRGILSIEISSCEWNSNIFVLL